MSSWGLKRGERRCPGWTVARVTKLGYTIAVLKSHGIASARMSSKSPELAEKTLLWGKAGSAHRMMPLLPGRLSNFIVVRVSG